MADIMDTRLDFNKCPLCGRAFVGFAGMNTVCEDCRDEEQYIYNRVRSIVRESDNKRLTIEEAAKRLRVAEHKIRYLVEKGLVHLSSGGGESLR